MTKSHRDIKSNTLLKANILTPEWQIMSKNRNKQKPLIDIDCGEEKGHLFLRTANDAKEWIKSERAFWEWLSDREISNQPKLGETISLYNNALNSLENRSRQVADSSDSPDLTASNIRELAYAIQQFAQGELLNSSDFEAEYIKDIQESIGSMEAAAALAVWHDRPWHTDEARQFHGAVAMTLRMEGGSRDTTKLVRKKLQEIANKYTQQYSHDQAATDELLRRLEGLVDEQRELIDSNVREFEQEILKAAGEAKLQRKEAKDRLEMLAATYDSRLALEAPVSYWGKKRWKHRVWTFRFGVLFLAFLIACGHLVYFLWIHPTFGTVKFWSEDAGYGVYGLTVIGIGLVTGLARILLRLMMSQLHMANDADERVTMVNTYLALRKGGHADNNHMQTIIERLFAPSSDGIVKDDIGSTTPLASMQDMIRRN